MFKLHMLLYFSITVLPRIGRDGWTYNFGVVKLYKLDALDELDELYKLNKLDTLDKHNKLDKLREWDVLQKTWWTIIFLM